jgi:hypothetical protein
VYAAVFSRAARSLHASRHSGNVLSKPQFMRAFGLTARQYNAVAFSLDGMESSIVKLRPGRIADLRQRIKAADKKLAMLRDPNREPKKKAARKGRPAASFEDICAKAVIASQDVPMVTAGLSKHATQTAISAAVAKIIAIACTTQKPISIEYLDFAKKKAQLLYASPGRQRMLSAFAYTRFAQTVGARAHDAGVEVVEVRAAYSSKIGRQKYARRYGLSVHRAAALVLARRAQRFPDRLKPSSRKRFATTCKDRHEPVIARLKAASGRRKARLETYGWSTDPSPLVPEAMRRCSAPLAVRGETPRCNYYASTRSGVGGYPTADSGRPE